MEDEIKTQFVAKYHGDTIGYYATREEAEAAIDAVIARDTEFQERRYA